MAGFRRQVKHETDLLGAEYIAAGGLKPNGCGNGQVFDANSPICAHHAASTGSHPLRRTWFGLIQEAPRKATSGISG